MEQENKTEVIVVGGGPAGIACAVTIARAGKKVVLIERGKFSGSKNVFGGGFFRILKKMHRLRERILNTNLHFWVKMMQL